MHEGSYLKDLSKKARVVLPLAKPIPMILSVNQIYSGYLQNLDIGAYMLNSLMYGTNSVEYYHKTEYFLKQAQSTPVELSVHMSGMKNIVQKMLTSVTKFESSLHPELKEIVDNLEIALRENEKFNVGAWIRLSDDINFAIEMTQEDMSSLKRKVMSAIRDSGVSVMDKVCGRHQVNHQNIFEELPYQALIPSDLGLPIVVESQMTYFYSLQGEMNIDCSFNKPSAQVSVTHKGSYTYNGYAGTVCPFTQELLVAGINVHRAVNVPSKVQVEVEPMNGQFRVQVSQNDQVKSNSQAIDVLHYHVKPYTAKKQLVFKDMTPAILHSNTKIIRSKATPKTYQNSFGQALGIDASLKMKTECDVMDTKTLMDSWANFNYNPFAASWYFWAETALTAQGKPSARLHEYTLYYNPSRSTTKAAEMSVQVTVASKQREQEPRKFIINANQQTPIVQSQHLQQSSTIDMRLHDSLRKVDSHFGYAMNAQINAKLIGGQEKRYTYSITAGAGQNKLQHKWNLHFENEQSSSMMKLCVNGQMSYPTNYNSNAQFQYNNHISFGQTCDQYYVNVEGKSEVSSKVMEFSSYSEESKKCQEATEEDLRLRDLIKYEHNEITKSGLEMKHSECVEKKLKYCTKKLEQSRALDQTDITITTSQTLPKSIYNWARTLNTAAKAVLYQYLTEVSEPSQQQNRINVRLNFDPKIKTVNVQVQSPRENAIFRNIRLPRSLQNVLPLIAGQNPVETTFKAVYGKPYYAKCTIGQGYVQTFDKKSYSYNVDECDHMITSDCSKDLSHAVLAKEVNGMKHVTLFHEQSKIELRPVDSDLLLAGLEGDLLTLLEFNLLSIDSKFVLINIIGVCLSWSQFNLRLFMEESDMLHSIDFLGKNSMRKILGAVRGDHMVTFINIVAVALLVKGLNISLTNCTLGIIWFSIDSLEGCLHWVLSSNERKNIFEAPWKADVSEDGIFSWGLDLDIDSLDLWIKVQSHIDFVLLLAWLRNFSQILVENRLSSSVESSCPVIDRFGKSLTCGDSDVSLVKSSRLFQLLCAVLQFLFNTFRVLFLKVRLGDFIVFILDQIPKPQIFFSSFLALLGFFRVRRKFHNLTGNLRVTLNINIVLVTGLSK